jgi:hypothetical protein
MATTSPPVTRADIPAITDDVLARARSVRPSRVLLTVLGAIGTVLGWVPGRAFVAIGWLAGRSFLIGAFFVEAVIYGFRQGAMLGPRQPEQPPKPPESR